MRERGERERERVYSPITVTISNIINCNGRLPENANTHQRCPPLTK